MPGGGRTAAAKGSRFAGVCQQGADLLAGEAALGQEAGAPGEVAAVAGRGAAETLAMGGGEQFRPVDPGLGQGGIGQGGRHAALAQLLADAQRTLAPQHAAVDEGLGVARVRLQAGRGQPLDESVEIGAVALRIGQLAP